MKKLLCFLLVLASFLCLAACEDEAPVAPMEKELIRYECDGLAVFLDAGFQKQDMMFFAGYFTGKNATVQIWTDELEGFDESISTSQNFAQWHADQTRSQYESMEIKSTNGVYYTVAVSQGSYQVCGYYTNSTHGWIVQIVCKEVTDDIIRYATSAEPIEK